jgi:hypothetical protein
MGKRGWLHDVSPPPPGRRVLGFLLKIWAVKFPSVRDNGYERPVADGISIGRL